MISRTRFLSLVSLVLLVIVNQVNAQKINKKMIDAWVQPHLKQSYAELYKFLSIPNDSHFSDQINENIKWLDQAFQKRKFTTKVLKSSGNPSLFAEKIIDSDLKTVLFYFHLDGQAVDSSKWDQPNPYLPVLKEKNQEGQWEIIDWSRINSDTNDELRIF